MFANLFKPKPPSSQPNVVAKSVLAPEPEPTVHKTTIPSSFWIDLIGSARKKIIYKYMSKHPDGRNATEGYLAFGDIPITVKLEYNGEMNSPVKLTVEGPNFVCEGRYLSTAEPEGNDFCLKIGRFDKVCINANGSTAVRSRFAGADCDEQALEELTTLRLLID